MKLINLFKIFFNKNLPFTEKEISILESKGFSLSDDKTIALDSTVDSNNYHSDLHQIKKVIEGFEANTLIDAYSSGVVDSFIYRVHQKKSFSKLKDAISQFRPNISSKQ